MWANTKITQNKSKLHFIYFIKTQIFDTLDRTLNLHGEEGEKRGKPLGVLNSQGEEENAGERGKRYAVATQPKQTHKVSHLSFLSNKSLKL